MDAAVVFIPGSPYMFIPTTKEEMQRLRWQDFDVILISGDSYLDSPMNGAALVGKILIHSGYRVGIIAQPDVHSECDITRLGEPRLFWGVTGGAVDSMVANTTPTGKPRRRDDFTPGGINNRRPNRAVIVYTNLIRRYFKQTRPVVLGGIEASLRRVAHYDFWSDKIRAPILFDSKADFLLYGMADKSILDFADHLRDEKNIEEIPGLCFLTKEKPAEGLEIPSFEEVSTDKQAFGEMFRQFYVNNDPLTAKRLVQRKGERWLVQNPPQPHLTQSELDTIYNLDFERSVHPYYAARGKVKALETIQFSISTHRGCYGECSFCAIAVHEGRTVTWRSVDSVVAEAERMTGHPDFKGIIQDLSGPTADMYGFECLKKMTQGACPDKRCLYPDICPSLPVDHSKHLQLLKGVSQVKGVKKVFVASGIRYDMVMQDRTYGQAYLKEITAKHVSGQMKVAPEHSQKKVLQLMGKPGNEDLLEFKRKFDTYSRDAGKKQFLTYYYIAAHPGCTEEDMYRLRQFALKELRLLPEQVQVFTPTPSTYASLMYYTEIDPFSGEKIFVEKNPAKKEKQKLILMKGG